MKLRISFVMLTLVISFHSFAGSPHQAVGIHGMALVKAGDKLIASHMPLHNSIHAHQVVFEVAVSKQDLNRINQLFRESQLVSVMPEVFDLHQLINGQLTQFNANIFSGHFERGGLKVLSQVKITVTKILLAQNIRAVKNGSYYVIKLNEQQSLLVHQIGQLPSFDQLLLSKKVPQSSIVKFDNNHPLDIHTISSIKNSADILIDKIIYTETQDFQVRK